MKVSYIIIILDNLMFQFLILKQKTKNKIKSIKNKNEKKLEFKNENIIINCIINKNYNMCR